MADDNQNKMKDEVVPDIAPFDPTKKKKKKKVVFQDTTEDSVDKLAKKTENLAGCSIQTSTLNEDSGDAVEDLNEHGGEDEEGEGIVLDAPSYPWEGSYRDYAYEELLDRVFNIRSENNPYLAGDMRRIVLRPPQVLREGTKKTILVDFMDQCKRMHRDPSHLMAFLLAELGTSGSLDGQQRLVVKGRFAPKNFETVLRGYVNQYVQCHGCKSSDTVLSKESRLFRLRCEKCGADRTVTPIKAGFVARVGRRNPGT